MSEDVAQAPVEEAPEMEAPTSEPKTESGDKSSQPKSESKDSGAKEGGPAPWAKDLADLGLDDPRFDQYLRDSWQPRMTQYEQQVAQYDQLFGGDIERAQIMAGLAESLENDPQGTYEELGRLLGFNDGEYDEAEDGFDEGEDTDGEQEQPDEYREWVMQKMQEEQQSQQDQAYESLLTELEEAHPGFDRELFHAAIVAYDGDPEMALQWYMKYHRAPEPADAPDGPTPLGEGNPAPPEVKEYSGIGDAISDFMSEEKTRSSR
jgi:tetratricopeptide (TPR) repeat protein